MPRNKASKPAVRGRDGAAIRCAIYTRKSTEEGLEQEFNSLDAQREACAAYVLSLQHEGWTLLPGVYDDGGFSGGSMNRPALQRLLAEVQAGKIDVIVVYKVDRLTRSLADFAKIVEVLDNAGASFVSVTQAFNTTNSMGRLTLNVLLSFAQFEREVTGERIRDKIAASKKKGMWMDGPIPLGYDVVNRALVVNEPEAAIVRQIFEVHQTVPTLRALAQELDARGVRSRVRQMRDGRSVGGSCYTPGGLQHILSNLIYLGEVSHKSCVYPGIHPGIVDRDLWKASQGRLSGNVPRPRTGLVSPLAGRISDGAGKPLIANHANKGGRRYRYYVSTTQDQAACWRLPAGDLEAMVHRSITALLDDPIRLYGEFGGQTPRHELTARGRQMLETYRSPTTLGAIMERLGGNVVVDESSVCVRIDRHLLAELFNVELPAAGLNDLVELDVPASLRRRGHELRLVYATAHAEPIHHDDRLIELLGKGWAAWDELSNNIRIADPTRRSHLCRLARLRFLAPDIVTAILHGRQPIELTARSLLRANELPVAWPEQRKLLGFA